MVVETSHSVERLWGTYTDILRRDDIVVKFLYINRNQMISNQRHLNRKEKWIVVSGYGSCLLEQENSTMQLSLSPGTVFNVPRLAWHQVKCDEETSKLVVLEIQEADGVDGVCREDDIERKADVL